MQYSAVGYKNDSKLSIHLVFHVDMPFDI
jgi:hypothetical protein